MVIILYVKMSGIACSHSPHKKTPLGVFFFLGGSGRGAVGGGVRAGGVGGFPHESGLEMLIRANDRWPPGTLTAAPFFYVTWLNDLTWTTGFDGNLCCLPGGTARHRQSSLSRWRGQPAPQGHARLRLWKWSLPTTRALSCGNALLSKIGMISPAMAQQLAHENMLGKINCESI